jgi:hypothetical protein
MLKFRPIGRIRLWRPLKILLDEAATGLSRPNTWRIILISKTGIIPNKLHGRSKLTNLRPALYILMQQAVMFSTRRSQKGIGRAVNKKCLGICDALCREPAKLLWNRECGFIIVVIYYYYYYYCCYCCCYSVGHSSAKRRFIIPLFHKRFEFIFSVR